MGGSSLPPGFRFHPTDEELVGYYLKRKVEGLQIELEVIPVIDLYKFDPWELPEKSFLPKGDMEWFFFCPRDRKYPNGSRTNRATRSGYWKATGKDRKVVSHSSTIGYRKTLVFYCGRAPGGDRTDWVMHEYLLSDDVTQESQNSKVNVALCRIIKKNEHALKNGDTKVKQVGSSSSRNEDFISSLVPTEPLLVPNDMPFEANYMGRVSSYSSPIASPYHTTPTMEIESIPMETNPSSDWLLPDFIFDSSKETPQGREVSGYFPPNEFSANSMAPCNPYDQFEFSHTTFSNFAENVELSDDFSQFGSMPPSPYSGYGDYTNLFDHGSMPHEGPESWNQAPICRQSSGEGSFGEYNELWSQEDNYIVVI